MNKSPAVLRRKSARRSHTSIGTSHHLVLSKSHRCSTRQCKVRHAVILWHGRCLLQQMFIVKTQFGYNFVAFCSQALYACHVLGKDIGSRWCTFTRLARTLGDVGQCLLCLILMHFCHVVNVSQSVLHLLWTFTSRKILWTRWPVNPTGSRCDSGR